MISKINAALDLKKRANTSTSNETKPTSATTQSPIQTTPMSPKALQANYMLSFGAKSDKQKFIDKSMSSDAVDLFEDAAKIAKTNGHKEINEIHVQKATLDTFSKYLDDIETGVKNFDINSSYKVPLFFSDAVSPKIFEKKEEREKVRPIIEKEIKLLDNAIKEMPKSKTPATGTKPAEINLSSKLTNAIVDDTIGFANETGQKPVIDGTTFMRALNDLNEGANPFKKFILKVNESIMVDTRNPSEIANLSFYKDKSKNVLKNVALGSNITVTYDGSKMDPKYIMDSIIKTFETETDLFGKNGDTKPNLVVFNENIKEEFVVNKIRELAKDLSTDHVLLINKNNMILNSPKFDGQGKMVYALGDILKLAKEPPKNIKMIFIDNKESYMANIANPLIQDAFSNFNESSFPTMSAEELKKAFKEQPLLYKKIDAVFSPQAISKTVEAEALLEGSSSIEKTQKLMKKIASYYAGKKEITEKDVKAYVNQIKDTAKTSTDENSMEIVFDTGKKLKDIIGKPATKKEAAAIIKQIKKGALGTKGALIYSQDGSVGGGRSAVAKAIAGELGSPFLEINAMDFGTERVDILGGDVISPEKTMKKIFSKITTQAEANTHKTAVLYIKSFDHLLAPEALTYNPEHYNKAMAQLQREMDVANKKGLNILVLGSINFANAAELLTRVTGKFIDKIEVESPSRNIEARKEILEHLISKKKLKLGANEQEAKNLMKNMSETSNYFSHIDLVNFVDKIKSVMVERNNKIIKQADITEAYLQLTTGRPASGPISQHRKDIVTTHEWGHGFTLERMHSLAEKQNIPWHLGDRVNFITLDPRGVFGGAMFGKDAGNEEHSFEKVFTDLICDYGGHSTEKHFYNIDGSWGITGDLAQATQQAEQSVGIMGQGGKFGKKSLNGMSVGMSERAMQAFESDRDAILDNARLASDLIVKSGTELGTEFTEKYSKLVGTGECLVQGDTFREEISQWLAKQPPEKLALLDEVDKTVLEIIKAAKKGVRFDIDATTVSERIKTLYKSVAHFIK